jgi:hypothetical protein
MATSILVESMKQKSNDCYKFVTSAKENGSGPSMVFLLPSPPILKEIAVYSAVGIVLKTSRTTNYQSTWS